MWKWLFFSSGYAEAVVAVNSPVVLSAFSQVHLDARWNSVRGQTLKFSLSVNFCTGPESSLTLIWSIRRKMTCRWSGFKISQRPLEIVPFDKIPFTVKEKWVGIYGTEIFNVSCKKLWKCLTRYVWICCCNKLVFSVQITCHCGVSSSD